MKAPDKIYLQVCWDCPNVDCKNCKFEDLEDNVTWCKDRIFGLDVEYIRKDALLEWLKKEYETISWYYEKMKHVTGCIGDSYGKVEAYKKVIDKIESL